MGVKDEIREVLIEKVKASEDPLSRIIGQAEAKKQFLASVVAGHDVILKGPRGCGKTTLAKEMAKLLSPIQVVEGCEFNCQPDRIACPVCRNKYSNPGTEEIPTREVAGLDRFVRIQGSPDLTVQDLLGDIDPVAAFRYSPTDYRAFTPGKLLKGNNGIVFCDEIAKMPQRLQGAFLQVLDEGKATISGYDVDYPADFLMIATSNLSAESGDVPLIDVLLDRVDVIEMSYPTNLEDEVRIIGNEAHDLGVQVEDKMVEAVARAVQRTRTPESPLLPASVRASIKIYEKTQAYSLMRGSKNAGTRDLYEALCSVLPSATGSSFAEARKSALEVLHEFGWYLR
jgi:magnesium chelatase subunit I